MHIAFCTGKKQAQLHPSSRGASQARLGGAGKMSLWAETASGTVLYRYSTVPVGRVSERGYCPVQYSIDSADAPIGLWGCLLPVCCLY